jgi:hypothetical protein
MRRLLGLWTLFVLFQLLLTACHTEPSAKVSPVTKSSVLVVYHEGLSAQGKGIQDTLGQIMQKNGVAYHAVEWTGEVSHIHTEVKNKLSKYPYTRVVVLGDLLEGYSELWARTHVNHRFIWIGKDRDSLQNLDNYQAWTIPPAALALGTDYQISWNQAVSMVLEPMIQDIKWAPGPTELPASFYTISR